MRETYYDILGVGVSADPPQLKAAYRKQALKWHPDKNQGSQSAEERFKLIAEAYSVLSNAEARRQYDANLRTGEEARPGKTAFDEEAAAAMFMREMMNLATELTFQNVPWSQIAPELVRRGCPESVALGIAQAAEEYRKKAVRKAAVAALVQAIAWLALGALVTAGSYALARPGGTYMAATGLFVFGGWNILRALFFLGTGRAPGAGYSQPDSGVGRPPSQKQPASPDEASGSPKWSPSPKEMPDGCVCKHEGETANYCTRCWAYIQPYDH